MDLYSGCSTLLQTSTAAGTAPRRSIRSLAAGTYAVKLTGSGTATHAAVRPPDARPAGHASTILSTKTRIEGGTLRLIGELYNNTTKTVGSTKVTAKLYNASNVLLATRTAYADLSYMSVGLEGAVPDRRAVAGGIPPRGLHGQFDRRPPA